jgi:hypothetical protein
VNKESTEDVASAKRSGVVSTLFKVQMQTKSITDVCRGEIDDTRQKKNEQGRRAATKEQPTSSDFPCSATTKKIPAHVDRDEHGETDRLGEYADTRMTCRGPMWRRKKAVDGPDVVWGPIHLKIG